MKVLRFETQEKLDEWLNDHELFECYDKDMNLIGNIQGPDADFLVSFNLAEINMKYMFCKLTTELTPFQIQQLKESRITKCVVTDDLLRLTFEQRAIIRRLRKDFEDAVNAGLMAFSNDDANRLYFINGSHFDKIDTEDGLSGEWKEIGGKYKFVHYSEEYLSEFVEIDLSAYSEFVEGNEKIDFVSYGCCGLPWYGHIKD